MPFDKSIGFYMKQKCFKNFSKKEKEKRNASKKKKITCNLIGGLDSFRQAQPIVIGDIIKLKLKSLATNQSGAAEAWWAHNPQVPGSKPGSDI